MFSPNCIIIKTAPEISLKTSFVRSYFMHKLRDSIKFPMKRENAVVKKIISAGGRMYLYTDDFKKAEKILKTTVGIHSFAEAEQHKFTNQKHFTEKVLDAVEDLFEENDSFAVRVKSLEKEHKSKDLEILLGSKINEKFSELNLIVNLNNPDKKVLAEVRKGNFYIYFEETKCFGGLPLGSQGNVAMFFTGRKEELAAALIMIKRGCNIFPVVEIETEKIVSHIEPLVKWNAGRKFTITELSHSRNLIESKNIEAFVIADTSLDDKSFEAYRKADEKLQILVFRPLLLYPTEMLNELYKMIDVI
ncbi:MAG: THUMP domain-containing protein [Candidatus Diapherotrites archaeon]